MNLLGLLPLKDWLYFAGVIAIAGFIGWAIHHEREAGAAKVEAVRQAEHAQAAAVAASAAIANQAETARRITTQAEVSRETDRLTMLSGLSARAAADSADQLRQRLAAAAHRAAAADTAAPGGCAATDAALAVQSDVLRGTLEAARLIGAYADSAAIAGRACVADYAALKP